MEGLATIDPGTVDVAIGGDIYAPEEGDWDYDGAVEEKSSDPPRRGEEKADEPADEDDGEEKAAGDEPTVIFSRDNPSTPSEEQTSTVTPEATVASDAQAGSQVPAKAKKKPPRRPPRKTRGAKRRLARGRASK
jgi:cell division septation protein DedD